MKNRIKQLSYNDKNINENINKHLNNYVDDNTSNSSSDGITIILEMI